MKERERERMNKSKISFNKYFTIKKYNDFLYDPDAKSIKTN